MAKEKTVDQYGRCADCRHARVVRDTRMSPIMCAHPENAPDPILGHPIIIFVSDIRQSPLDSPVFDDGSEARPIVAACDVNGRAFSPK